ncbi:hypothetical protein [Sphingomonas sp.]|jgi:hypothetical protein|uniref:hypothetical protein n=1 Tax=Sphingomonas sp. TaxID=28214 RepID=UPI003B3B1B88
MADIHWDHEASLMRVTQVDTAADAFEEWIARGTLREMVARFLELSPAQQDGLLLRASGPDWTEEYDSDAIRELAERPEYTGVYGAYDTAEPGEDTEALREVDR